MSLVNVKVPLLLLVICNHAASTPLKHAETRNVCLWVLAHPGPDPLPSHPEREQDDYVRALVGGESLCRELVEAREDEEAANAGLEKVITACHSLCWWPSKAQAWFARAWTRDVATPGGRGREC